MFKKSTRTALSLVILLYSVGTQQAHTQYVFSPGEAMSVTQPPASSSEQKAATDSNHKTDGAKKSADKATKKPRVFAHSTSGHRARRPRTSAARSSSAVLSAGRGERNEAMTRVRVKYIHLTGRDLVVKSGWRSASDQARAMYKNLNAFGVSYVSSQYRNKTAVRAIIKAYTSQRKRRRNAIAAMTRVIQAQVRKGIYISNHLRGRAFDIRSRGRDGAQLAVLREVVQEAGGRVVVEKNHYHIEL